MVAAAVLLVVLHFAAAVMLEKSHPERMRLPTLESIDETATCSASVDARATALPFD